MNENTHLYKSLCVFITVPLLFKFISSQCLPIMKEDAGEGTSKQQRKRHFQDEGETSVKRKKKEQEVKNYKSTNCQTEEEEDLCFTHLFSEDAKLPVMDKVESDLCIIDTNCKAKKEETRFTQC